MDECYTCAYFVARSNSGVIGDCRRYPPIIVEKVLRPYDPAAELDATEIYSATEFPVTSESSFCGEYRARDTIPAAGLSISIQRPD